jgi:hypothetical protein
LIKIPLSEGNELGAKRDIVIFNLKATHINSLKCKAIIDTGCPYSFIPEVIAKRTRVKYTCLDSLGVLFEMGPFKLDLKKLGASTLTLLDEDNKPVEIVHDMHIGVHKNRKHEMAPLPAFLGKDFLDSNKFSITFIGDKKYLTK